ncbi:hypothetical protein ABPG74_017370 [Tetrahymena malaccensis]
MKFNAETSVLLGNVLGIQEENKDSNSTKHYYNDWSERQKRFASQYNSSVQLNLQSSQQNINSSSIPNHNNKILLKKDFSKGPSLSLHSQQLSSGQNQDQNLLLNRVDNYYQIPTANPLECKICQINNSICSVCLQRQSKMKKKFLNPKGSESFCTNIPLYKYQHFSDQERLNNSYSYGESSKQSIFRKKIMPNKKDQNSRESLHNSQQLNSLQEKYQDMLKIKFKPMSSSNQNIQLISSIENKQNISISLDKIVPQMTTQKESQSSKQTLQQENKDEKILSDNYMNYILRIRQEEQENPQTNYLQTEYNSSIQYENNDSHDKIKLKNQLHVIQESQNNQSKKTNEASQHNPSNLSLQNQLKILDLNHLLSKQKNCSNYVNSQYIFDQSTKNKKNNLMNITQLNFIERNNFISKKKYESSIYKKASQDKRINQDNPQTQNPIVAATQTIQEYQRRLQKPKKNIIYSKVKPINMLNQNEKENQNIYKENDDFVVKRNKSEEEIDQANKRQYCDQNQQNLIYSGSNSLNKSNSKFQNENYLSLDEKSEILDYVEESYNDDQIFSGKNKSIAEQLQKYVRSLKLKIQYQNSQPKNIQYQNNNQIDKENKKLATLEPSEIKLSSLTQKSSDKNIFNFKYRKTLLKASTNFNTNPNNQSIESVDQDSIKYLTVDPKDQQQKPDNKMLNQDSTASLDALPISFPKLHKSQIKKHNSINQRSDLQLNAQKLNVGNRLDKQLIQNGKDLFYDSKTNKKQQVEKQIIYSQSFSKQNKLLHNQQNLSSNKQIKTDPDVNETELVFKNGIQMNTFLNKNRTSLKEIQFSNKFETNQPNNNPEYIERQNLKQQENLQDIDLCEWKHSPNSFISNIDDQLLLEKQENNVYESTSFNKAKKRKQKVIKQKNISQS